MKMNKRGGDKILSLYWFVILILVAGGVFGMVYVFYRTPYDVRELEANVLINKVADCVSYSGRINSTLISKGNSSEKTGEEFLNDCHLIFDSNESKEEQYYAEVNIYKLQESIPFFKITAGDNKLFPYCPIQEDKEYKNLPKCVNESFYSVDDSDNQYIIQIWGVVGKTDKNVKM
jgi:hypothetical protein